MVYAFSFLACRRRALFKWLVSLMHGSLKGWSDKAGNTDLLGDFVTLFCWRLSRKPPSERYPYGFAKFETLGTTTISILLIGGALGVGFHSYHLLIVTLSETAVNLSPGPLQEVLQFVTSSVPLPKTGHGHVHAVDPNAAWFAAVSVLTKEWLYRITKVVADEENSPVLLANAIHHRSDAYSGLVAFFAILGTWFFPALPLDPIGGKHFDYCNTYNHQFFYF
jgi:divalent metal cation (Fe/Co/Zn/Cd) transporter